MQVLGSTATVSTPVPTANAPALGFQATPAPGKPAAGKPERPVALLCCLQDGARHVLVVDCPSLDHQQTFSGHPALRELAAHPLQYAPPLPEYWQRVLHGHFLLLLHASGVLSECGSFVGDRGIWQLSISVSAGILCASI